MMSAPPTKRARIPSDSGAAMSNAEESDGILSDFRLYSAEMTAKQDRHERIVKLGRDLTVLSKRTIFALQRVLLDCDESRSKLVVEARDKLNGGAGDLLYKIAMELCGVSVDLYSRAYSPGIQEYIEARCLLYFIEHGSLISRATCIALIQASIDSCKAAKGDSKSPDALTVPVSVYDYVLGVADVGGELMRLATNNASSGNRDAPFQICAFIRALYEELTVLEAVSHGKSFHQKLNTMQATLTKLESACYALKIRGTEVPTQMLSDLFKGSSSTSGTKSDETRSQD
eukprot:scpid89086/ scgid26087/ Translin-associated protein X; Translin-associated factor X